MANRKWNRDDLVEVVRKSSSVRQVIMLLGLIPAGGNYVHIQDEISKKKLDTSHFTGKGWRKGLEIPTEPIIPLNKILVAHSTFQSYKLKKRLFKEGLKIPKCEKCGWAKKANDGRLPLELDHINGNRHDNRIDNLQILCPNCHSLQPTHRGRNMRG